MALPKDDYEDRGESDRRKRLLRRSPRAPRNSTRDALRSSGGARRAQISARPRLRRRRLWTRFGIGFAPDEWTWVIDKLKAEGFTARGDRRRRPCARRRRRQARHRHLPQSHHLRNHRYAAAKSSLSAAARLAKDAKAKYINSPECALYSKGRVLYRLKQARELLAKTKAPGLVVGEGYLDVIAFERAGIAAVAPCGTALTEEQLQLLWRAGGEPVLCFDGDAAGQRAADRALDLALPHLGAGPHRAIAYAPARRGPRRHLPPRRRRGARGPDRRRRARLRRAVRAREGPPRRSPRPKRAPPSRPRSRTPPTRSPTPTPSAPISRDLMAAPTRCCAPSARPVSRPAQASGGSAAAAARRRPPPNSRPKPPRTRRARRPSTSSAPPSTIPACWPATATGSTASPSPTPSLRPSAPPSLRLPMTLRPLGPLTGRP